MVRAKKKRQSETNENVFFIFLLANHQEKLEFARSTHKKSVFLNQSIPKLAAKFTHTLL